MHITQTCNASPWHRWMAIAHGVRDLFGGFTEQLEVAQHRIGDEFIRRKLLCVHPVALSEKPGAETEQIFQHQLEIHGLHTIPIGRPMPWPGGASAGTCLDPFLAGV